MGKFSGVCGKFNRCELKMVELYKVTEKEIIKAIKKRDDIIDVQQERIHVLERTIKVQAATIRLLEKSKALAKNG